MPSHETELNLCRSDLGDGGWSLHTTDGDIVLSGPAKWNKNTGEWSRPNAADYRRALRQEARNA